VRFLFSTGSLYTYSLDRCFELAARAGFDGMELMVDQRWDTRDPDYLRRLVDRHNMPVLAVHSPFRHHARDWAKDEPESIRKSVQLAEALDAEVVVHHLPVKFSYTFIKVGDKRFPVPLPGGNDHRSYYRWLQTQYLEFQASTRVTLCIENLPVRPALGRKWNVAHWNATSPDTLHEITRFPHITMDTAHLGTWGLEPADVYRHWGERVHHVHLSNFNGREHRRPEDGHLRLDLLLQHMAADGYSHTISLELHPSALDAGSPDPVVVHLLANSLDICRGWSQVPASTV
jgi:sugar phosphate isomerase/epimerase